MESSKGFFSWLTTQAVEAAGWRENKASPLKTSYKYGAYRAPVSRV